MKKININLDWERAVGPAREFWMSDTNPRVKVDLPDDFIITMERDEDAVGGASTGFFPGGRAVYTKKYDAPECLEGKTVLLDIEGAYMMAEVTLNGEAQGTHPYGYTPWMLDVTDSFIPGETNELEIVTRCIQPNSRWYSGGGVYRDVNLWVGEPCHISPWDVYVNTVSAGTDVAVVRVEVTVTNDAADDTDGKLVLTLSRDGCNVAEAERKVSVYKKSKDTFVFDMAVSNPMLWSAEKPALYSFVAKIETENGSDSYETEIGIRKITVDSKNGMVVNGESVKLLGGCIHHDNTLLGAAAFKRAEERKIQLLKDAGYNALRMAHNPPSTDLLDACDRIGMYVIDESFDCFRNGKNDQDYHLYFEDWWERDTTAMVLRDRNHPSIICWSFGNEISEYGGCGKGVELARQAGKLIHGLDPERPVMGAIHSLIRSKRVKGKKPEIPMARQAVSSESEEARAEKMRKLMSAPNALELVMGSVQTNNMGDGFVNGEDVWGRLSAKVAECMDIVGYNYAFKRYALDKEQFPNRVIVASETHASTTYDYYQAMIANDNVIGDFIWTAFDNLGEAGSGRVIRNVSDLSTGMLGSYPWLSCYQGDLDLDGNRRAQSYYRKIMWGKDKGIHLFSKHPDYTGMKPYGIGWQWDDIYKIWTYDDKYVGKDIDIIAYADADEVEFELNGKVVARVKPERLIASYTLPYEKGELKATAIKEGKVTGCDILKTAGVPARISLTPDRSQIMADGMDLSYITIELMDEEGNVVPTSETEVNVEVSGGVLAGLGSGNPCTPENYGIGKRILWKGRALAVTRANSEPSFIKITVSTKGVAPADAVIECK